MTQENWDRIKESINRKMNMEEDLRLLTEALREIQTLRRDNELMKARLDMFDKMVAFQHPTPYHIDYGVSDAQLRTISAAGIYPKDLVDQLEEFINARTITDAVLKERPQNQYEEIQNPYVEQDVYKNALNHLKKKS